MLRTTALAMVVLAGCAHRGGTYANAALPNAETVNRIVISKSERTLAAYHGTKLLKRYTVALGRGGRGDKEVEGDGHTPEGSYKIVGRHKSTKFHRFLSISYPNRADKNRFRLNKRTGKINADQRIGGAIGIHGQKRGLTWLPHKVKNWTQGCIALDNDEVDELFATVVVGTDVEIRP